jgi:hypothetical protein
MSELAEKLRALKEKRETKHVAEREYLDAFYCVPEDLRPVWTQDAYLRGYDDATLEVESALKCKLDDADCTWREGSGTYHCAFDNPCAVCQWRHEAEKLTARVRELEAQIAAQPKPAAVEGCTVRAVGVVGAVLGHSVLNGYDVLVTTTLCSQAEALRIASHPGDRVVAIVDPDALVMLASRERVLDEATVNAVCDIAESLMYAAPEVRKMHVQRIADIFAQPAQERDA